ncbi:MAG: hypothetical protein L0I76_29480 [Pseudonocardia sp.]|nr:hypothetical protein [Pseudonocardia sp.]
MDLTDPLLRFAARVPHVLLVPVPGRPGLRMDTEQVVAHRGWWEATSPADADALLVAGRPGPELDAVVEHIWRRIPAPRIRVDLDDGGTAADLEVMLDSVPGSLADPRRARAEATAAATAADVTDHTDHGGGHHHDHHMDMPLPGGLSMADVAEDRDGLALDVLRLPLGPVLPDWPAGLVVDVELQGDVVTAAGARVLDAAGPGPAATRPVPTAARGRDVVARVLAVAGWPGPAARARDLRDRVRAGDPTADLAGLLRTVRRSRVLRLMLRRIGDGHGADVAGLLEQRLARLDAYAAGAAVDELQRPGPADLGARLAGAELAAARLLVAALDPDVDGAVAGVGDGQEDGR